MTEWELFGEFALEFGLLLLILIAAVAVCLFVQNFFSGYTQDEAVKISEDTIAEFCAENNTCRDCPKFEAAHGCKYQSSMPQNWGREE